MGGEDELGRQVSRQAEVAVADADAILLVMDGKEGPQAGDAEVVQYLRTTGRPLFLVINKIDNPGRELHLAEFYSFGIAPLYPVSAAHKLGRPPSWMTWSPAPPRGPNSPRRPRVSGWPWWGAPTSASPLSSTWVLGEERLIVSDLPGTTRDAIDTPLTYQDQDYVFIYTAGLRRPSHVEPGIEKGMVLKAMKALYRCDIAFLLLDAREGVTGQDLRIASLIAEENKGCVVGLNKWDLVPEKDRPEALQQARDGLDFLPYAPQVPLSVLTGYNVLKVFTLINEINRQMGLEPAQGAEPTARPDHPPGAPTAVSLPPHQILLPYPARNQPPHVRRLYEPPRRAAGVLPPLPGEGTAEKPGPHPHPPASVLERPPVRRTNRSYQPLKKGTGLRAKAPLTP